MPIDHSFLDLILNASLLVQFVMLILVLASVISLRRLPNLKTSSGQWKT